MPLPTETLLTSAFSAFLYPTLADTISIQSLDTLTNPVTNPGASEPQVENVTQETVVNSVPAEDEASKTVLTDYNTKVNNDDNALNLLPETSASTESKAELLPTEPEQLAQDTTNSLPSDQKTSHHHHSKKHRRKGHSHHKSETSATSKPPSSSSLTRSSTPPIPSRPAPLLPLLDEQLLDTNTINVEVTQNNQSEAHSNETVIQPEAEAFASTDNNKPLDNAFTSELPVVNSPNTSDSTLSQPSIATESTGQNFAKIETRDPTIAIPSQSTSVPATTEQPQEKPQETPGENSADSSFPTIPQRLPPSAPQRKPPPQLISQPVLPQRPPPPIVLSTTKPSATGNYRFSAEY